MKELTVRLNFTQNISELRRPLQLHTWLVNQLRFGVGGEEIQ